MTRVVKLREASDLPLSAMQLGIWFAQQIDPLNPGFNIGEYVEVSGTLDPDLFESALQRVVTKSTSLCVRFVEDVGGPRQIIGDLPTWSMPFIDLSAAGDPRAAAECWMASDLARPIELTRGPLFGYALFRLANDRFIWYARYHHIVMDCFGMSLVAQRLAEIYTAWADGRSIERSGFGHLSVLIEEDAAYLASDKFNQDRLFWSNRFAKADGGSFAGGPRPATFLRTSAYLERSEIDRMHAVARSLGASLARVIIAAMAICRHRVTGSEDLMLSLPVAARSPVLRGIPGMAANVVPLRLAVCSSMKVPELLGEIAQRVGECLEHQFFPIADLRRNIGRMVDGWSMFGPSVNIMRFNYDLDFAGHRSCVHNLSYGPIDDITVAVYDRLDGNAVRVDFDANPTLHSIEALADFRQRFLRVLDAALAAPDRAIGSLDILAPAERHTILREWNDTAHPVPDATLPQLFAAQAARTPDVIAVVFEDTTLSYAELDAALEPAGASSARPRGRPRGGGRAVRRALARDGGRPARHPQGRRRLSAARSRLSDRTSRLHAGRCSRRCTGHPVGAARLHLASMAAPSSASMPTGPPSPATLPPPRPSPFARKTPPTSSTPQGPLGCQRG